MSRVLWPRTFARAPAFFFYKNISWWPPASSPGFLYFMKASMSTTMRFPVVTYVQCKPVLHTDMVTMMWDGLPLFPLGVQHLHEERLGRRTAATVLLVQVLLASRRQWVDFRQQLQHFVELILKKKTILIFQDKNFLLQKTENRLRKFETGFKKTCTVTNIVRCIEIL